MEYRFGRSQYKSVSKAILILSSVSTSLFVFAEDPVSPFERPSSKPSEKAPPTALESSRLDKLEFTGLMAFGGEVTISLYDTESKESIWVPLNGTEEGVSVTGFDEGSGTISVLIEGRTRRIPINENEIVAIKRSEPAARVPVAQATKAKKPAIVKDPETIKKEEEARLFVSDLLASSMIQREKYRQEREARARTPLNGKRQ